MRTLLILAAFAVACGGRPDRMGSVPCAPVDDIAVPEETLVARMAGHYQLTMVATRAGEPDHSTHGTLTLIENTGTLRQMRGAGGTPMAGVTVPYYGTTDVDLDGVGAVDMGSTTSDDATRPGVLAVFGPVTDGRGSLVLRLGATANTRNATPFDGGYTVLRVQHLSADGFAGTWASGVRTEVAAGYFCARPVPNP